MVASLKGNSIKRAFHKAGKHLLEASAEMTRPGQS